MAQHTLDPTVGDGTVVVTSSGGKDWVKTDPAKVVSAAAGTVNGLTAKATVVDADCIPIEDSAAGYARKKTLFSTIVTYFLSVARAFASDVSIGAGDGSKKLSFFSAAYFIKSVTGLDFGSPDNFTFTNAAGLVMKMYASGKMQLLGTAVAGGTVGAQTISKPSGSVNFAAGATSLVVTNALALAASSAVFASIITNDATAVLGRTSVADGSFTLRMSVAPTAETRVAFLIIDTV